MIHCLHPYNSSDYYGIVSVGYYSQYYKWVCHCDKKYLIDVLANNTA